MNFTRPTRSRAVHVAASLGLLAAASCSAEDPERLATNASALSANVVIAEVYANTGAIGFPGTYQNGYVVLFNRGSSAVSLNGMIVQRAFDAYTFSSAPSVALPNVSLQPGKYFLVGLAIQGVAQGGPLPATDASNGEMTLPLPGKIALVSGTPLSGCGTTATPCPTTNIVDLVGFGATAQQYEGSGPAPAGNATTSMRRKGGGCVETDDNAADFELGAPTPKNSATPAAPCGAPVDAGTGGTAGSSGSGGSAGAGTGGSAGAATGGAAGAATGGSAGAASGGSAGAASGGSAGAASGGSAGAATGGSGGATGGTGGAATGGSGGAAAGGTGGAATGGSGGATSTPGGSDDDGGCGCETPGQGRASSGLAFLALAGVFALARRRKTAR